MSHSLYAYAWDLLDQHAIESVKDLRLAGIDALTVAFSYHAGKFIAPWHSTRRVIFPEDGTVYFSPSLELYDLLKPIQARCTEGIDLARTLKEAHELPVYAWVVLLHNTRLGQLHPQCTVRNAYGDHYPYSLCPANPSVVRYAATLCRDIASHDVAGLKLETPGYLPYAHGYHHEFAQIQGNLWMENLLALCFCDHCIAHAHDHDLDADRLRYRVMALLDEYFASAHEIGAAEAVDRWFALLSSEPELQSFTALRCAIVNQLLRAVRGEVNRVRSHLELRVIPTVQQPHTHAYFEGSDLAMQSRIVDRLELPLYQADLDACLADAAYVIEQVGAAASLSAILRPGPPDMRSLSQLRSRLRGLARQEITDVSFYNFGLLRREHHRWISAALEDLE